MGSSSSTYVHTYLHAGLSCIASKLKLYGKLRKYHSVTFTVHTYSALVISNLLVKIESYKQFSK